ncbi:hypothetical protein ACELLULO517_15890 [Acidisoma cellulosilytica]|uniref:Uncharacterized protein n=1 Tax=Acidisoma cellulosilyticum TaxID=2802395 RepID=A0A964E4I3_9PROT|nr:hypothetical protein [Acidisoma cellulosilyticum]MCB8881730.1 hypothetical protein [Acidisoma cellulosilyticum]
MTQTAYEAKATRAWQLIHDDKIPAKKAAVTLKIDLSDLYEMLAFSRTRREILDSHKATFASISRYNPSPANAGHSVRPPVSA